MGRRERLTLLGHSGRPQTPPQDRGGGTDTENSDEHRWVGAKEE